MTPFLQDPDFTLYVGDALDVLRGLPDESVHCAATSPPFYALRDYGTGTWEGGDPACYHAVRTEATREKQLASTTLSGGTKTVGHQREGYKGSCPRCGAVRIDSQIGLEDTPEEWAARLVDVFRELRRVLRSDGTLWVECGDSYAASSPKGTPATDRAPQMIGRRTSSDTLKPKDLLGQPWLLAFALRADGWWLRQAIIWHKPNGMPESATDRCTTAHSYVFLLSKSARYHFDAEAIAEPAEWARWGDQTVPKYEGTDTASGWMQPKTKAELALKAARTPRNDGTRWNENGGRDFIPKGRRSGNGQKSRTDERRGFDEREDRADGKKNPRSVWTIPTQGYSEAHFATWPEALVERIIKAGCPAGGVILDPFMGSGTTALVARRLGRKSIGIELKAEYARLAAKRLQQQSLLALDDAA